MAHPARGELMITELVDGTLPGGLPKFVELLNVGSESLDLGDYSIGNYNNGSTDLGGDASTVLSGSLGAGELHLIAYEFAPDPEETSTFEDVYGFAPDLFIGPFINGDDVIALFDGPATGDGSDANIVDIYGVIGVDGTGTNWEYTDGYSFRKSTVLSPNTTFTESEWTFGGANSLETGDDEEELALILALTTPGTHEIVPEPSTAVLFLLALIAAPAALRLRRAKK
jgi:hypothetical protein